MLVFVALLALGCPSAVAREQGQLYATQEGGYARLILSFPHRQNLPEYDLRLDNGVLSLEFSDEVDIVLPDVGATLPDYLSVARVDPDRRGLRLGLRDAFQFNRIEAGERLFIDLLPTTWQGMPPALPQEVVDELAERARQAAIRAEQDRKARGVKDLQPQAQLRLGRNPTFLRLQFDWNVPTQGNFVQDGADGLLAFEWPVGIDLAALLGDLPPQIVTAESRSDADGGSVLFKFAEGVQPRFYQNGDQQYLLDFDIPATEAPSFTIEELHAEAAAHGEDTHGEGEDALAVPQPEGNGTVKPFVTMLGATVRIVFPFEQETPAAVFRRGDAVWLMFDTMDAIEPVEDMAALANVASGFHVDGAGDTQLVRLDLNQDRLATMGSEGRAWVLSLGDVMLTPTEPITLSRRRDMEGLLQVLADVARPARVHRFTDPLVGDELEVVTAYPPARNMARNLDFVEFSALRTVHGLVIKPKVDELSVVADNNLAIMSIPGGITASPVDTPRALRAFTENSARANFLDLGHLEEPNPLRLATRQSELMTAAANAKGAQRDKARLELAQFFVANRLDLEAIGLLQVLEEEKADDELVRATRLTEAVANLQAGRTRDALAILEGPSLAQDVDAMVWRTIARADNYDFAGARLDAAEAQAAVGAYPSWVKIRFAFAAARAGVEGGDIGLAETLLSGLDPALFSPEDLSQYLLLSGRVDEARERQAEALDTYGQVVAMDFRPTRAEAVFRTLRLLDQSGKLDLEKGAQTLAAEAMLWRGNPLEADMLELLADLHFRRAAYREGFETAQQAVSVYPESPPVNALRDRAQTVFTQLFLDGEADKLGPVDALSLYYDFRDLTPSGMQGDAMIRNLARRLVRVDLLAQAAELLQYQLDNRLRGASRAQVGTDLAVIYLADRQPQQALHVLNSTRLPDLPPSLERQRKVLEARAMLDGGREQLALDMIKSMSGRDVDMLRIDANWRAKRYSQAGEMLEAMYAASGDAALSQPDRMGVLKAAVGFVLADDTFGLARLRSKFSDRLVTTPEWPLFDYVTGPIEVSSLQFKAVASQIAGQDGLNAFLSAYRDTYGTDTLTPLLATSDSAGDLASR